MALAYIAFGSNKGDRHQYIRESLAALEEKKLGKVLRQSPIYQTAPVDCQSKEDFLNGVLELITTLSPRDLLNGLMGIEKAFGRNFDRGKKSARTIDLDILFYDYNILNEADLIIPHPEIQNRLFVLKPLCDVRGNLVHPILKKKVREILAEAPQAVLAQKIEVI